METFEELVDYFKKYWLDEKEFVVMPNSVVGRMYADKIKESVFVSAIICIRIRHGILCVRFFDVFLYQLDDQAIKEG